MASFKLQLYEAEKKMLAKMAKKRSKEMGMKISKASIIRMLIKEAQE